MGLLDEVGQIAGAVAAVEATEKLDPDASLLTKGIAGFKGAGALEGVLEKKEEEAKAEDQAAAPDGSTPQA
ncbi:hypothetical protein [Ralstonia syzygii]|uniref:hypothetical protein n=1 Tax=Ralstonia syzygii TaxID=28097 RepID=UPI0018D057F7|nr:hypothetical protein [Ralstonia syzygii]